MERAGVAAMAPGIEQCLELSVAYAKDRVHLLARASGRSAAARFSSGADAKEGDRQEDDW